MPRKFAGRLEIGRSAAECGSEQSLAGTGVCGMKAKQPAVRMIIFTIRPADACHLSHEARTLSPRHPGRCALGHWPCVAALSRLPGPAGSGQLPECGAPGLDEVMVACLLAARDGGEGVQCAEVVECLVVVGGEVLSVAGEERFLEVRVCWPYAEAEAYQVAQRVVGAGMLEVDEVEVACLVVQPVAALEVEVAGNPPRRDSA